MKLKQGAQIAFLLVGALTVLEFVFVRGMFTWLIAVAAVAVVAAVNVVLACRDKDVLGALHYVLTAVALCMGYLALA